MGGGEPPAVQAERHAARWAQGPLESADFLPGHGIPQYQRTRLIQPIPLRLTQTTGGNPLTIGAERHTAPRAGVLSEGMDFLPGGGVPHLHRPIPIAGGEPLAIWAERHGPNLA